MVTKFKRSESSLYPILYHSFMAKALDSDELIEYFVEDLTEKHVEKAVDLILNFLAPEETFQRSIKLAEKENAKEILTEIYSGVFKERVSLACFVSGSFEMVGLNALKVESKGIETEFKSEDKEFMSFLNSLNYLTKKFDVFEHFNVEHYLSGVGLCVNSKYRGRKIATELLKARVHLLKELDLTATSTIFTTLGGQKSAVQAGFELKDTTSFEELQEKFPEMDFSQANTSHCKTFALKI